MVARLGKTWPQTNFGLCGIQPLLAQANIRTAPWYSLAVRNGFVMAAGGVGTSVFLGYIFISANTAAGEARIRRLSN